LGVNIFVYQLSILCSAFVVSLTSGFGSMFNTGLSVQVHD